MTRLGRARRRDPETPRPVFVVSPGRTGTTLLMKILARSPEIWVPGDHPKETRLLTLLTGGIAAIAGPNGGMAVEAAVAADPDSSTITQQFSQSTLELSLSDAVPRGANPTADVLCGAWAGLCRAANVHSQYYAEKSIGLSIPDGIEVLDPLVIHLVRDPRDMTVSVREFDKVRGFSGFGRDLDESDESYASRMVGMYRTMFRMATDGPATRPDHEMRLRYEDLITDRAGSAGLVGDWLGVAIPPKRVSAPGGHATSGSPESSIGRWRSELSDAAAQVFVDEIGELLAVCGYDV